MLRAVLIVIIFSLIYVGIFAKRGFLDWRRMVDQNENMVAKIESTQERKKRIDKDIKNLRHDARSQERLVREVLGYVKNNETVIEFE